MADDLRGSKAGAYPREYRPGPWTAIFGMGWALLVGGFALIGLLSAAAGGRTIPALACFGVLVPSAYLVWAGARRRIVLRADGIDVTGLLTARSLQRAEIAGYRLQPRRGAGDTYRLESGNPDEEGVSVVDLGGRDQAFEDWFGDLSDLDKQEIAAAKAKALADPALGANQAERQATLDRWRNIMIGLSAGAILLSLWVYFAPEPTAPALIAAVLTPAVGAVIVRLSNGRLTMFDGRKLARAPLGVLLIAPAAALGLYAAICMEVIDAGSVAKAALGAAVLLTAVLFGSEPSLLREQRPGTLVGFGVVVLFWAWGAVMALDRATDADPGRVYPARITDMTVRHGRSTHYELHLGPWGQTGVAGERDVGSTQDSELDVDGGLFDRLEIGGLVCLRVHPGGMGWRWYRAEVCPPLPKPPQPPVVMVPAAPPR